MADDSVGDQDEATGRLQAISRVQAQSLAVLRGLTVEVEVLMGATSITIGELLDLQSGSVVALDRGVDEPVELLVGGQVIAHGELVSVEGEMGVRITQIVAAEAEA